MKPILVGFVLALWMSSPVLAVVSKTSQNAGELRSTIQKAEKLLKRDEPRQAIQLLELKLKKTGWKDFDALRLLARVQLETGNYLESLAATGSLLQVADSPERQGEAYLQLGVTLYQSSFGRVSNPRAALLLERAVWLHSSSKQEHRELSRESVALARAQQPLWQSPTELLENAATALEKAIELRGGRQPLDHYHLAEVLAQLGRHAEAGTRLDEYFELAGSNAPLGPGELRCWLETESEIQTEPGETKVIPPRELETPALRYVSRRKKYTFEGGLRLQGIIDEQGQARCMRPLRGLPIELANQAAAAVRSWKFEPATLDGRPIPVRHDLTLQLEPAKRRLVPQFQIR